MKSEQTLPKPATLAELETAAPDVLWNMTEDEDEEYTAP